MHTVLIADGEKGSRDLLARALTADDFLVEAVSRGEDVLRRIAAKGVDVLVLEVHLPDISAWDLLPEVRRIDRNTVVITMTGDDAYETARKVRAKGGPVFYYGLKPLDLQEMREVVRCSAQWAQGRQPHRMQYSDCR